MLPTVACRRPAVLCGTESNLHTGVGRDAIGSRVYRVVANEALTGCTTLRQGARGNIDNTRVTQVPSDLRAKHVFYIATLIQE